MMRRILGWLLICAGTLVFLRGLSQFGPQVGAWYRSLPTPSAQPRCENVILSDGKPAIACRGGADVIVPIFPVQQPALPSFDTGGGWDAGDSGSDFGGGWDSGTDSGSWDAGGWGGSDSGSWDSGGSDSGSWDSGSDSGSW